MAIAYDAGSSSPPANSISSATFSHTVGAWSDRILIVGTLGRSTDGEMALQTLLTQLSFLAV